MKNEKKGSPHPSVKGGAATAELKKIFLDSLATSHGIVTDACRLADISRNTYYRFRERDPDFAAAADEVMEEQVDTAVTALLQGVRNGDMTAIIYLLKTRGYKQGWSEKAPWRSPAAEEAEASLKNGKRIAAEQEAEAKKKEAAAAEQRKADSEALRRRVERKKRYIVTLLKKQDKYSPDFAMQAQLLAATLVRIDLIAEDIFSSDYQPIKVEISREGNERAIVNPKEQLYRSYIDQAVRILRGLGMNLDGRGVKTESDSLSDFIDAINSADD